MKRKSYRKRWALVNSTKLMSTVKTKSKLSTVLSRRNACCFDPLLMLWMLGRSSLRNLGCFSSFIIRPMLLSLSLLLRIMGSEESPIENKNGAYFGPPPISNLMLTKSYQDIKKLIISLNPQRFVAKIACTNILPGCVKNMEQRTSHSCRCPMFYLTTRPISKMPWTKTLIATSSSNLPQAPREKVSLSRTIMQKWVTWSRAPS